jgi:hypothetical protein
LAVLAAKAVISAEAPALQEGEHPMNPLWDVRRHVTDDEIFKGPS